ncbi:MAG TPA: hypothetical protein EYQ74_05340 [Planctomycetes bacterium]|nr:hypothetical protein [Planctomycetota bacterium]
MDFRFKRTGARHARTALFCALLGACQATAPKASMVTARTTVRGDTLREASGVVEALDRIQPELEALLPGVALEELEIWIQDQPHVYTFPSDMDYDAEGLYAPDLKRILLARGTRDMERVLAHELTHAALQSPWDRLPGTLEEGLCDCVSAYLAPEGAARLRAGRLSGAALACGGIQLALRVTPFGKGPKDESSEVWETQILLSNPPMEPAAQRAVFAVSAGLSSSKLSTESKRAFYGLSFLVIERIVNRNGFSRVFELCQRAEEAGLEVVPEDWILEAAGLEATQSSWRRAAVEALGEEELMHLMCMYPSGLAGALANHIHSLGIDTQHERWWEVLDVECALVEGTTSTSLNDLWPMRVAVAQRLRR